MKNASSFSTDEAASRYLPILHEIAMRIELASEISLGHTGALAPFAREFVYLEFRKICELLALGCLQLHGDLSAAKAKSILKEWNAYNILTLLCKEYAHAFPVSADEDRRAKPPAITFGGNSNALSLSDFKTLYHECGTVLHRGTITAMRNAKPITHKEYERVNMWLGKITDLLNNHAVTRAQKKGFYLCKLRTTNGYPMCEVFTCETTGGVAIKSHYMNPIDIGYFQNMFVGDLSPQEAMPPK